MIDLNKELPNENLTQKDIMQFLLHSTQHVATREELENVKQELKQDISKVDDKISKAETSLRQDISKIETSLRQDISKVETSLRQDNKDLIKRMDRFMFWSLGLTVTSTFMILTLMYKIVPK